MLESHLGRKGARRRSFDSHIAIQACRISKCIGDFALPDNGCPKSQKTGLGAPAKAMSYSAASGGVSEKNSERHGTDSII